MNLADHPTVRCFHENAAGCSAPLSVIDAAWLRQLCVDCGADDAGLVEISRPALNDQRADILQYFPSTKTLLSFACRMNRGPIRSPARSAANLEFHGTYDHSNFTGKEEKLATVTIREDTLQVQDGHQGEADLLVTADSDTWLGFLAKERSLLWALLRRKIRIKGSPRLLVGFGKCFPS
jgi:SCP-2 sterol transfer family